jgi:hypothetical protein
MADRTPASIDQAKALLDGWDPGCALDRTSADNARHVMVLLVHRVEQLVRDRDTDRDALRRIDGDLIATQRLVNRMYVSHGPPQGLSPQETRTLRLAIASEQA